MRQVKFLPGAGRWRRGGRVLAFVLTAGVAALGGTLTVASDRGTTVTAVFPLEA